MSHACAAVALLLGCTAALLLAAGCRQPTGRRLRSDRAAALMGCVALLLCALAWQAAGAAVAALVPAALAVACHHHLNHPDTLEEHP